MKKLASVILISFFAYGCGCDQVSTGYRGVQVRFGELTSESLPEGLYFYNPFTTSMKELDVRTQSYENKTAGYSQDAQVIDVMSVTNLNLKPDSAHLMFKELGYDWLEKLVPQIIQGTIKEVFGKHTALAIISERNKVSQEITDLLVKKLADKKIIMTSFEIAHLDFDDGFETAVKEKVIAVENAKRAQNETVKIQEEAKQRVISAKAEAESMTIRSKALSQNRGLVEYEAVQKWDGKMPQYMLGNSVPFINLGK